MFVSMMDYAIIVNNLIKNTIKKLIYIFVFYKENLFQKRNKDQIDRHFIMK